MAPLLLLVVLRLAFAEGPATAPALVDNPFYEAWAKTKPGTTVALKMEQGPAGVPLEGVRVKYRLVTAEPAALTLEVTSAGMDKGQTVTVPRKCAKGEEFLSMMPAEQRDQFALKDHSEGKESITVNGTSMEAVVYTIRGDLRPAIRGNPNVNAGQLVIGVTSRMHIVPSLPGGIAKIETTIAFPGGNQQTQSFSAVTWEGPDGAAIGPGAGAVAASQPAAATRP